MPIMPIHPGMPPVVPIAAPSGSTGGGPFNFRWRRGGGNGQDQTQPPPPPPPPQHQAPSSQPDPRSFGRFFRRNNQVPPASSLPHLSIDGSASSSAQNSTATSSAGNSSLNLSHTLPSSNSPSGPSAAPPELLPSQVHLQPSSNPSERFVAQQQFAQAHQAQALWAQAQARSGSGGAGVIGGGRRRAGSLNSVNGQGQAGGVIGYTPNHPGSNSSSPSLAHAQIHASGAQSARTSVDDQNQRPSFSSFVNKVSSGSKVDSRSRSNSTLDEGGAESIKSVESGGSTSTSKEGGKEKDKDKEGKKNWARLGTWSQVVGRSGKKNGQSVQETEEDEGDREGDEEERE